MKNIIDGEECCFRCGISKTQMRNTQHGCFVYDKDYNEALSDAQKRITEDV